MDAGAGRRPDEPRRGRVFSGQPLLPVLEVLSGTTAPRARDAQMLQLLEAWQRNGASRLDRDLDGKVDDSGAAIMDAAWPRIARAVMTPLLGPLVPQLEKLGRSTIPPTTRTPPTTTAATGTWTRTCAGCPASRSAGRSRASTAGRASSPPAGLALGHARRGRDGAGGGTGPGPCEVALRRERGADRLRRPAPDDDALDEPAHLPAQVISFATHRRR